MDRSRRTQRNPNLANLGEWGAGSKKTLGQTLELNGMIDFYDHCR